MRFHIVTVKELVIKLLSLDLVSNMHCLAKAGMTRFYVTGLMRVCLLSGELLICNPRCDIACNLNFLNCMKAEASRVLQRFPVYQLQLIFIISPL